MRTTNHTNRRTWWTWLLAVSAALLPTPEFSVAQDEKKKEPAAKVQPTPRADGLIPLNMNETVLLDKQGKRLLLKTHVTLREGALELFCCLKQTKEHESILSLDSKALNVHTGLLLLEAKPGTPVANDPEFRAPTGQRIDLFVNWKDEQGKSHREPAQNWVRHATRRFFIEKMDQLPAGVVLPKETELRYDRKLKELSWYGSMSNRQKAEFLALSNDATFRKAIESFFDRTQYRRMDAPWVFAGSGTYTDPCSGKKFYLAEEGDLICVSNFPSATLDVAVNSSAGNDFLLFEAWTERIPPRDTPVTLELIPVFDRAAEKRE